MGRATAKAPMHKTAAALNAPLFRLLADQLDSAGRRIVLDLGAASTPMLSMLGRSRCRVEIADLACDGSISRLNSAEPADGLVAIAESLLPRHRAGDFVDLVFCWDLLNSLKPEAISALMNAIAGRARPDTLAHALIVYSERSMPEQPGRFVPTEDWKLVDHAIPGSTAPAPRYSPEFLGRIMGGFAIESARLLANGMQEFLFRLKN
jgi:hypothetical protein